MKIGDSQNIQIIQDHFATAHRRTAAASAQSPGQNNFGIGKLLKGKVLSVAVDGQVLLSVGYKTLTAQSLITLKPGQEIWLEVLREGDMPLLGLAARKGAIVDLITQLSTLDKNGITFSRIGGLSNWPSTLIPGNSALSLQIEQFVKILSQSLFGADADPRQVVNNLGLVGLITAWRKENFKTQDQQILTPFSEELSAFFSGADVLEILGEVDAGSDIGALVNLIESFARLNSTPTENLQMEYLLFPCFFQGECGWGEWLLNFDREEGRDGTPRKYGLTFFLQMSHLGEVYLQINLKGDSLQGVFTVEDQEAKDFIDENLPELTEILTNLGFGPINLSSRIADISRLQLLKNSLIPSTGTMPFGLLDLTV